MRYLLIAVAALTVATFTGCGSKVTPPNILTPIGSYEDGNVILPPLDFRDDVTDLDRMPPKSYTGQLEK